MAKVKSTIKLKDLPKELQRLVDQVGKEPGVRVKLGKTNGRYCLHIIKETDSNKFPRGSYTIYQPWEWWRHSWNGAAKRARREARMAGVAEAVANREAI